MTDIIKRDRYSNKALAYFDRDIGPEKGEISADQYKDESSKLNPDCEISFVFNCNGGSVEHGRQIYNAIRGHLGPTTALIQGLCASSASFIALGCDGVNIAADALMMIHDPFWSVSRAESRCSTGNQKLITLPRQFNNQKLITIPRLPKNNSRHSIEMMKRSVQKHRNTSAERRRLLESDKEFILNTYFLRTGTSRADLAEMMAEETWFSAFDCIQFGMADSVTAPTGLVDHWDLTQFSNPTNFLASKYQSSETARAKRKTKVNRKQTEFMRATVQKILHKKQQETL